MQDDGDDRSEDDELTVDDIDIGISDKKEQEYLDSISFEWCDTVRKAGTVYRDNESVAETADELSISPGEAREAVATYIHIYTHGDSDDDAITAPGKEYGLRYFRDSEVEPEEIYDNMDWDVDSPDDVRKEIRIFAGYLMENIDVKEIDLDQEIPETPNQDLPSIKMMESMQKISTQLSQNVVNTLDISNIFLDPGLLLPMERLQETIQSLIQPLEELTQEIDFEVIIEQQRIRKALKDGIHGFDSPGRYNPNNTSVDEESKSVGKTALRNFISDIEQSNVNDLDDYVNRLKYGLERYEEEDYIASTHVFLSVQDGLLDYINQQTGNLPSGGYYTYDERQEAFENEFPEIFGIKSQTVAAQWNNFLGHRHKIMHGDPDAYIDENIASVALIFLVLAIYTALDLMDQN
jgi:hypothetical protein